MMKTATWVAIFAAVSVWSDNQGCDSDDDTPTPYPEELADCSDMTREFWTWDLSIMPPRSELISATCRLMGPSAYLYVADNQWETYVSPDMAENFMDTFEFHSGDGALHPDKGIFDNDQAVFGDVPDALDDDPRIYLLLMDIKDYVDDDGNVYSFDGYFNAYDELPDEVVAAQTFGLYHSNEVEMLYLNSRIREVTTDYTLAVAAHELQHMIAYNYDTSEEVWLSESEAEVAMLVNGRFTDTAWVADYMSDPSVPLVTSYSGNYGAFLLWGMYLYEQVGVEFMRLLEEEPEDGITGLNNALRDFGAGIAFDELFAGWVVANTVQDPSMSEGEYGYQFTADLPEMEEIFTFSGLGGSYFGEVEAFGVDYVGIEDLSTNVTLSVIAPQTSDILAQLLHYHDGLVDISSWTPDAGSTWAQLLSGGESHRYQLVITNLDSRSVDSGNTTGYEIQLL